MEDGKSRGVRASKGNQHQYLVQFPAGLVELVKSSLIEELPGFSILDEDDSSIRFLSSATVHTVRHLRYLTNSFLVLSQQPRGKTFKSIWSLVDRLPSGLRGGFRSFRIMLSVDGVLTSIEPTVRQRIIKSLEARTGARFSPRGADEEFWILSRREWDTIVFAQRLTQGGKKAKGALSGPLSELLIRESRPRAMDRFLDPFAGSGALLMARSNFPYASLVGVDKLPIKMGRKPSLRLLVDDSRRLGKLADGSVDVVVTDPPWGEFEEDGLSNPVFSRDVFQSLYRVLGDDGRFVMLISRRVRPSVLISARETGFRVTNETSILVSGHPAVVISGMRERTR